MHSQWLLIRVLRNNILIKLVCYAKHLLLFHVRYLCSSSYFDITAKISRAWCFQTNTLSLADFLPQNESFDYQLLGVELR